MLGVLYPEITEAKLSHNAHGAILQIPRSCIRTAYFSLFFMIPALALLEVDLAEIRVSTRLHRLPALPR